jgi:hypothetical protein
MKLKVKELEYLSAWAREEKAIDPYALPAHQLQAAHKVKGVVLIRAIKAWARAEGRRDEDIFGLYSNPNPPWPWASAVEFRQRLQGIVSETGTGETSPSKRHRAATEGLSHVADSES